MVTKVENALMWLYVKTWENLGQHVIDQDQMWNFGEKDLKEAIIGRGPRTLAGRSPSRWWSGPRRNFGIRGPSRPVRGSLIIEISYPTKKNSEENDLVESLRKLILGKFKDKEFDFYQWSRKIYDEVVLMIDKLFHNCCY